jgi:DNA (cytosine-5)-methyltransferase 1
VLKYYYPNAISYNDITKTDFTIHRGTIDILTGGFPCQPYSAAGKRLGKEDDRHLWPEMLRAIREIQPTWVVGENVRGLTNWNGGMVFDEVQADLEAESYEVTPFLLPACAVNAPHRRDRIWFVAYSNSWGNKRLQYKLGKPETSGQWRQNNEKDSDTNASNPMRCGQPGQGRPEGQSNSETDGYWKKYRTFNDGGWPTESPVRRANDGFSETLDTISFSEWAKESIKAYGNAIVPQIAYQIFKSL